MTHGPPRGIGDSDDPNGNVGDDILRAEVLSPVRVMGLGVKLRHSDGPVMNSFEPRLNFRRKSGWCVN